MNNYHFCEEIGRGKFSVVYKGRIKKTMNYIGIKSVDKSRRNKLCNEVKIIQKLKHDNIIRFYNWYQTQNHIWAIFQYCPGGDLLQIIQQDKIFSQTFVKQCGANLRDGLLHMHQKGVIYADIKPSNILCNQFGVFKYGDFGLSRFVQDKNPDQQGKKGTPYYMAPQLFQQDGMYSYYSDFWGLGCVLYELMVGNPPFTSNNFQDLVSSIINEDVPRVETCSDSFNDLINDLLQKDPTQRLSWQELLAHNFWDDPAIRKVELPQHLQYEEYLKSRGVQQRTRESILYRESMPEVEILRLSQSTHRNMLSNYSALEKLELNGRDQVFDFNQQKIELQIMEDERTKLVMHHRSESAVNRNTLDNQQVFEPVALQDLIVHVSDLKVEPIIGSKEVFESAQLPGIQSWTSEQILAGAQSAELEFHLSRVYSLLVQNTESPQLSLLGYLKSIILNASIANKLINSAFVQLLLQIMLSKSSKVKGRTASIFGQMLRHATFIDKQLAEGPLAEQLVQLLKDQNSGTRQKALAALGEYLFFSATQMDEEDPEMAWDIPDWLFEVQLQVLNQEKDVLSLKYIVKTIENITAQSKRAGVLFSTQRIVQKLSHHFVQVVSKKFKHSIVAALSNIVRLEPAMFQVIINSIGGQIFIDELRESDAQIQQCLLTMVLFSLRAKYPPVQGILQVVLGKLDDPGIIIKSKSLLVMVYALKYDPNILQQLLNTKLLTLVDRLTRDSYKYVQCCLYHFLETLAENTVSLSRNAVQGDYSGLQTIAIVCSFPCGRYKLPYPIFLDHLSVLLQSDHTEIALAITQSVCGDPKALLSNAQTIVLTMLGPLLRLNASKQIRFRSLKIVTDTLMLYLNDQEIFDPNSGNITTKLISDLIKRELVHQIGALLDNQQAIALCGLRLLRAIFQRSSELLAAMASPDLLELLLSHLTPEDPKLNTHLLLILCACIQAKALAVQTLLNLGLVPRLNSVISHVVQKDWNIQQVLQVLYELLLALPKHQLPPQSLPLADNIKVCADLLQEKDRIVAEKSAHCLLLIMQLFSGEIAERVTSEKESAILTILKTDKPSLQRRALKLLKSLASRQMSLKRFKETLIDLQDHYDSYIEDLAGSLLSLADK